MESIQNNEAIKGLFTDLGIDPEYTSPVLESFAATNNKYVRDLKLNVTGMLNSKNMPKKEALLLALAIAVNEKNDVLTRSFEAWAAKEGATPDEIAETYACTSLMNVNNVLYRFRKYVGSDAEYYNKTPAGLRMSIMMSPVMGKQLFELMSLVISAVNGCESCVVSHEKSVKEQGAEEPKIYDAIRIGATVKGLCAAI